MINYFEVILVLVIIALGAWIWKLYQNKQEGEREASALEKEKDEYADLGKGLEEYNKKMQEKREAAINKIIEMLSEKKKIGSGDVADALRVSSRTAVRYLDEIEKQGMARQVGRVGKSVFYTRK